MAEPQPQAQPPTVDNGASKPVSFSAFRPRLPIPAPKANDAVQFYKDAFGAEEINRVMHPKRKADHETPLILTADLKIASAVFCVSDMPIEVVTETKSGGQNCVFCLETDDVDAAIAKAVAAGAVAAGGVMESEGGGRVGHVKDPFGFVWVISSPIIKPADVEA